MSVPVAAGGVALLASAPLAVFASHYGYSVLHGELWISLAILAAAASFPIVLFRHRAIAAVLFGVTAAAFVDVQFASVPVWAVMSLGAGIAIVALFERARQLLSLAAATVLLSTLAGTLVPTRVPQAPPGERQTRSDLPFLLHVILDEHISPTALPRGVHGDAARQQIADFYQRHGMTVFPDAYSEYFQSNRSISHALNGVTAKYDESLFGRSGGVFEWSMRRNAYFDRLLERGYLIRAYQSDYIDMCTRQDPRIRCDTYGATDVGALRQTPLGVADKMRVIVSGYLGRSDMYVQLRETYARAANRARQAGVPLPAWKWERDRTGPITAFALLDRLGSEAPRFTRGEAVVAHLMAPHYPYVYDEACRLLPVAQWTSRYASGPPLPVNNTPEERASRYEKYAAQLRCLYTLLDRFMSQLPMDVMRDAVLVFHGDHGSRIMLVEPSARREPQLTPRDLIDGYSTLFAVRVSGARAADGAASAPSPAALSCLVGTLSENGHAALGSARCAGAARVYLLGSPGRFVSLRGLHDTD
jgi:hypothetical protein